MTQLFVVGEVVGLTGVDASSVVAGAHCKFWVVAPSKWRRVAGDDFGSSQCDSPGEDGGMFVFQHPVDVSYETGSDDLSTIGMPRIELEVRWLDAVGRSDLGGYAVAHVPATLGVHEMSVRVWRPRGSLLDRFATSGALQKHSKALVPYVDAEYTAQPYLGEVCLHFACANRSLDMVQRLISAKANVLQPHAGGKFFYSNSHLYYGGSPLNIAACLGDRDVSHPSRLAACRLSAT